MTAPDNSDNTSPCIAGDDQPCPSACQCGCDSGLYECSCEEG